MGEGRRKNDNKKGREVKGSGQGWGGRTVKDEEQASSIETERVGGVHVGQGGGKKGREDREGVGMR